MFPCIVCLTSSGTDVPCMPSRISIRRRGLCSSTARHVYSTGTEARRKKRLKPAFAFLRQPLLSY